jgi:hypothetical protein
MPRTNRLEPTPSTRSSQPLEPHCSHLREARIIRVKSIAEVRRSVESGAHIYDTDPLTSIGTSVNNT